MGEAVLLSGGASRRMGQDKANLPIGGVAMAHRIVKELQSRGWPVTVLGGSPIEGCDHVADESPGSGPLAALAGYRPKSEFVFVAPCDVPKFDGRLPETLQTRIEAFEAVIPVVDGRDQTLCALYRHSAFVKLAAHPEIFRVRDWIEFLRVCRVDEVELTAMGGSADWARSANTPDEFDRLTSG